MRFALGLINCAPQSNVYCEGLYNRERFFWREAIRQNYQQSRSTFWIPKVRTLKRIHGKQKDEGGSNHTESRSISMCSSQTVSCSSHKAIIDSDLSRPTFWFSTVISS